MIKICECLFEEEDMHNIGYSLEEFDLGSNSNMSIRKNLRTNMYEIFHIKTGKTREAFETLEAVVNAANKFGGKNALKIEHGSLNCKLRFAEPTD